jgi:hypothetical protein
MNKGFYTNDAVQTIQPGASAVFNTVVSNDDVGHVDGTGSFILSGGPKRPQRCNCCNKQTCKRYSVSFGANIAVPEGETVGPISVALAVGGGTVPASTMIVTPAAVEEYFNVSTDILVPIVCGCCQSVTITNTSTIPINMQNASVKI